MVKFIGNNTHTFDVEKIVVIWWNSYIDNYAKNVAHVCFIDGSEIYLHHDCEDDLVLINALKAMTKTKSTSK